MVRVSRVRGHTRRSKRGRVGRVRAYQRDIKGYKINHPYAPTIYISKMDAIDNKRNLVELAEAAGKTDPVNFTKAKINKIKKAKILTLYEPE